MYVYLLVRLYIDKLGKGGGGEILRNISLGQPVPTRSGLSICWQQDPFPPLPQTKKNVLFFSKFSDRLNWRERIFKH